MEAVATGDHVAFEYAAGMADDSSAGIDALDCGLEVKRQPALDPRGDQILDHLGLPVDRDRATSCELAHRDVVALAVELEMNAVMLDALAIEPRCHPGLPQQL